MIACCLRRFRWAEIALEVVELVSKLHYFLTAGCRRSSDCSGSCFSAVVDDDEGDDGSWLGLPVRLLVAGSL